MSLFVVIHEQFTTVVADPVMSSSDQSPFGISRGDSDLRTNVVLVRSRSLSPRGRPACWNSQSGSEFRKISRFGGPERVVSLRDCAGLSPPTTRIDGRQFFTKIKSLPVVHHANCGLMNRIGGGVHLSRNREKRVAAAPGALRQKGIHLKPQ